MLRQPGKIIKFIPSTALSNDFLTNLHHQTALLKAPSASFRAIFRASAAEFSAEASSLEAAASGFMEDLRVLEGFRVDFLGLL